MFPNLTRGPEVFVEKQLELFQKHNVVDRVVYQSFDWRTIIKVSPGNAHFPNQTDIAFDVSLRSYFPSYRHLRWLSTCCLFHHASAQVPLPFKL